MKKRLSLFSLVLISLLLLPQGVLAEYKLWTPQWNSATGSSPGYYGVYWQDGIDGNNWVNGSYNSTGQPVAGDVVQIGSLDGMSSVNVVYFNTGNPTAVLSSLSIVNNSAGSDRVISLEIPAFSSPPQTLYTGRLTLSGGGNAVVYQDGGAVNLVGSMGDLLINHGTYNLAAGSLSGNYEQIGLTTGGVTGIGTLNQSGGTNTISGNLQLGDDGTSQGAYNLSNGSLSAANEYIGNPNQLSGGWSNNGRGVFTQTGGTNSVQTNLYVAGESDSWWGVSVYNLGGTGVLTAGWEYVGGDASYGAFRQTGGTNTVSNDLSIGNYTTASGSYDLGGGTLSAAKEIVGHNGKGTFTQTGGSNLIAYDLVLGNLAGGNGSYNLGGTGDVNAAREYIGVKGSGSFSQTSATSTNVVGGLLSLGRESGGQGTYALVNGALSVNGEYVGEFGTGVFTQQGGWNTVNGYFAAGVETGSNGSYSLQGGEHQATHEYIGYSGTGTYTQSGGTNQVAGGGFPGNLVLGYFSGGKGDYTLNNGILFGGHEYIGREGTGTFTQTGGSNAPTTLVLGNIAIGSGTYNLNGGTLGGSWQRIGEGGTGIFSQTGGTNAPGEIHVGYETTGVGQYTLAAGTINTLAEFVGNQGKGTFTQTGGTNSLLGTTGTQGYLQVGYAAGSDGTYNLQGGGLSGRVASIGVDGSGKFSQSGGIAAFDTAYLGDGTGATGSYDLSGSGTLLAKDMIVGVSGSGSFTQSGGTNGTGVLGLGEYAGSTGSYTLSGGNFYSSNFQAIGIQGTGTFTQSGGSNAAPVVFISTGAGVGTYDISGGSLAAGGILNGAGGRIVLSGIGSISAGAISNSGIFNYSAGTLTTNLTNNISGIVNLSDSGTRTINGDVTNNGTFYVINTTAVYTGSFMNAGAYISNPSKNYFNNLFTNITGYLVGSTGDEFHLGGNFENHSQSALWNTDLADLYFSGGTHAFFVGETGRTLTWDDMILEDGAILDLQGGADLYVDSLSGVNLAAMNITGYGHIHYQNLNGSDVAGILDIGGETTTPTPTPEPATMLLLGSGLIGLASARRKFRKQAQFAGK